MTQRRRRGMPLFWTRPCWYVFVLMFAALAFQVPPAWGLDAQGLFRDAKDAVVVVFAIKEGEKGGKLGSGVVLRRGDLVATNYHVIEGEGDLRVKLPNGSVVKVLSVRAESPEHDLAILEIPPAGRGLKLASGEPQVGEEVMAIGNPRGLERTLSTGIVSGIRQRGATKVYQITAPISPGSSGGPIINDEGEVVGLASFYATGGQNLNFAIPASYISELLGSRARRTRHLAPKSKLTIERDASGIQIMQSK